MGALINRTLKNAGYTIEDYLNHNCNEEENFYNSPIINIVQENGIMGTPEQIKLKELYPALQEAVLNFLSKKNHSRLMIHEEEGKPPIINMFEYRTAGDNSNYSMHKSAMRSFKHLRRNGKINARRFVYFGEKQNTRINNRLRYNLSLNDYLYELAI